jgi:hypothetical protein
MTLLEAELERGRLQSLRSTKNSNEKKCDCKLSQILRIAASGNLPICNTELKTDLI